MARCVTNLMEEAEPSLVRGPQPWPAGPTCTPLTSGDSGRSSNSRFFFFFFLSSLAQETMSAECWAERRARRGRGPGPDTPIWGWGGVKDTCSFYIYASRLVCNKNLVRTNTF